MLLDIVCINRAAHAGERKLWLQVYCHTLKLLSRGHGRTIFALRVSGSDCQVVVLTRVDVDVGSQEVLEDILYVAVTQQVGSAVQAHVCSAAATQACTGQEIKCCSCI